MPNLDEPSQQMNVSESILRICSDFIVSTKNFRNLSQGDFSDRISEYLDSTTAIAKSKSEFRNYWSAENIPLPRPIGALSISLSQAMEMRRSSPIFNPNKIDIKDISAMLQAAYGLKENGKWIYNLTTENTWPNRSIASAGGLYPLEIFPLVVGAVDGLKKGLYHYEPQSFSLTPLPLAASAAEVSEIIPVLKSVPNVKVVFLIVGVFPRTNIKYGRRGYRFVLIEAGHIQAHLGLAASALGLGYFNSCEVMDRSLEGLLYIDGVDEALVSVGIFG